MNQANTMTVITNASRDHAATVITFKGGRKCLLVVNLKWKENDDAACGGKFYLDWLFSGGNGMEDSALKSRVVESGGPVDFDVDSNVIALFECDCPVAFPDGDCMGLDEPEGLFANYIDWR